MNAARCRARQGWRVRPAAGIAAALAWTLLLVGTGAGEAPAAWDLLFRAIAADRKVSYRGTQETELFAGGEARRSQSLVLHRAPDVLRIEYVAPPPLAGLVVQEESGLQRILNPAGELVRAAHPWRPGQGEGLQARRLLLLRVNYRAELQGRETVAGRPAAAVALVPRAVGNPWRKLWVDEATALILQNEGYDATGRLATRSRFTAIDFAPRFRPTDFALPAAAGADPGMVHPGPGEREAQRLPFDPLLPGYLPPGYVFEEGHLMEHHGVPALHLAFTDGLNTLSLFEAGATASAPAEALSMHQGDGFGMVLRWAARGLAFTLVGDLPAEELRKIAGSVPGAEGTR